MSFSFLAPYQFPSAILTLLLSHFPPADGKYLVLPSGELHIRDVGPEDGYKSYQCRTKHRLTGETRLSATKGRLVITEPVGATRPKFPTTDDSRSFKAHLKESLVLLCPAQAFPVPFFRISFTATSPTTIGSMRSSVSQNSHPFFTLTTEPVGALKPKLATALNTIQGFNVKSSESLALLCPAQAYPVPFFR
ncbi:hypothetical protein M8J76_008005 [Diaphorina citri]|nr:hypothetical protein M8J76_008005 [Diaphorina citri]